MRVASSHTKTLGSPTVDPTIDGVEARWAAEAVASLLRQLPSDSVVGIVLRNTYRELNCLSRSADRGESEVVGPVRVRVAA